MEGRGVMIQTVNLEYEMPQNHSEENVESEFQNKGLEFKREV